MEYLAIVTALALLQATYFGLMVGRARAKYGIKAPATSGHDIFERTFRVHQNTQEQLITFLPALWLFGEFVSPIWGAGIGLVFVLGRVLYAQGYIASPEKRGIGFMLGFVANAVLVVGTIVSASLRLVPS